MYMSQLKELGIERSVHRTRLKLQILDHFLGECQEQLSDGKSIVLQPGIVPGKYLEHLPQDTTKHPNARGIWLNTT